jgi:hypothetical protein
MSEFLKPQPDNLTNIMRQSYRIDNKSLEPIRQREHMARPAQISHHTTSHTEQPSAQGSLPERSEHATQRKTGPITVFLRTQAALVGLATLAVVENPFGLISSKPKPTPVERITQRRIEAQQKREAAIAVDNSFETLGEAWLFGLHQVMTHGEEIQDGAVVARDISLDTGRAALLLSQYESPSDETKLDLRLKEILGHFVSIEIASIDDPVIAEYADQQRIDYTRKRYGRDSGSGGYGEFIYGQDSETLDSIVNKLLLHGYPLNTTRKLE